MIFGSSCRYSVVSSGFVKSKLMKHFVSQWMKYFFEETTVGCT